MMVVEFLRYAAELREVSKAKIAARLREVCSRCGLLDVLGKDVGQLSKGYRQRVGLAQALIHDPDLLILDEPTSGLDPNQIVEIRALIRDLGRDKTVILSTHILPEVQATCSRIIIINDGRLVADDTPEALTQTQVGTIIKLIVKARGDEAQKLSTVFANLPGVREVERGEGEGHDTLGLTLHTAGEIDARESIFTAAVENRVVLLDMHRERVSLEDTFRRLTKGEQHVA
jgi:ABC-2 type transport system ATP-binding protein